MSEGPFMSESAAQQIITMMQHQIEELRAQILGVPTEHREGLYDQIEKVRIEMDIVKANQEEAERRLGEWERKWELQTEKDKARKVGWRAGIGGASVFGTLILYMLYKILDLLANLT